MARIGDFASAAAPIGPDTPGAEVFDRFQSEPDTLVIAVIDGDRRPVGLIERNAFTLKMAAEFGRALYARRPAATHQDDAGGQQQHEQGARLPGPAGAIGED